MIWFFLAGFISGAVGMILAGRLRDENRVERRAACHKPTDEEMAILGMVLEIYRKEKEKEAMEVDAD